MGNKLPGTLATLLTPEVVARRTGYAREFVSVEGAVRPRQGELEGQLCREKNTIRRGEFRTQVGQAPPTEGIVLVGDGASSHQAQAWAIPETIRLRPWPPDAPELNPQELVGEELREEEVPNRGFTHLDAGIRQVEPGLPRLAADSERLRSLTAWPWIVRLSLNAH